MIVENALVVYKNKPALVKEISNGKITISLQNAEQVKVRDKDIELIHPGPVKSFSEIEVKENAAVKSAWELLLDDAPAPQTLKDFTSLVFGEYNAASAYSAYCLLSDGLYFSGTVDAVVPKSREAVEAEERKRGEKQRETGERAAFLERIKNCLKKPGANPLPSEDARFLQDVEALAYGKSAKSRTMKELGLGETPEDAHSLLLTTGVWTPLINPHPSRFGISSYGADIPLLPPPPEERRDLCHLSAFAIDSPWSNDPDDAVSIETSTEDKSVLYVHVADPASSVAPGSPEERSARDRGATLYLPETTIRMFADNAISLFALGLSEKSPALTFKMTLDKDCEVLETEIFPSVVKVRRITYEDADRVMDSPNEPDSAELRALYDLAMRFCKRRTVMGAINIDLPEVHVTAENGNVEIKPVIRYRSAVLVRECMIIAGEGAGNWAAGKGFAFPFISQEVELQGKVPGGMAGSWQLRRCMRPRILSTKPGRHQGLGLDTYTQVTSPLRRYTDLLAHLQIRAFLRDEKLLSSDEVMAHLGAGEAAAVAVSHAERFSKSHWKMVYLSGKKDSVWDAAALEQKGNRWAVVIPALALETQVSLQRDVLPNDDVRLILKSANIVRGEAVFVQASGG
ncbi:MAG: RNB domain-containing ribonuclease [Treponema sp.]|jgi:exoribonuclease-2|nr:RNB domain-containing ribonuclease [Treponema sp.]